MKTFIRLGVLSALALALSLPAYSAPSSGDMGFAPAGGGSVAGGNHNAGDAAQGVNGNNWNSQYSRMSEQAGSDYTNSQDGYRHWYQNTNTAADGQRIYAWGDAQGGQTLGGFWAGPQAVSSHNTLQQGYGNQVLHGLQTGMQTLSQRSVDMQAMRSPYNLGFHGGGFGSIVKDFSSNSGPGFGYNPSLPPVGTGSCLFINTTNGW